MVNVFRWNQFYESRRRKRWHQIVKKGFLLSQIQGGGGNLLQGGLCLERSGVRDQTLKSCIRDFTIHLKSTGKSAATIECYLRELNILEETIGNVPVSEVGARDLENLVIQRWLEGTSDTALSAVTMNKIKSTYRLFFSWAMERGRNHSDLHG